MDRVTITNEFGATAEITNYGAHLLSWKPSDGRERLFLSRSARFDEGKAIRGGVPVIFPQFNEFGPGVRHGFARTQFWEPVVESSGPATEASFRLVHNPQTLAIWPYRFEAIFTVSLQGDDLLLKLTVKNTDDRPFDFTAALHTYLAVDQLADVTLQGLGGTSCWDNNGDSFDVRRVFEADTLSFSGAIDRVFFDVSDTLMLQENDATLAIDMEGFRDVVVWNPGAEGAQALADMDDNEYANMLCVEAAVIDQPVNLVPGGQWHGCQVFRCR